MKGGVPCLGAMFCRQSKNTVADDAIIVQKHVIEEISPSLVNETRFWRGKETALTLLNHDVYPDWEQGELHVCFPSDGFTTVLEATPSTKHEFHQLQHFGIELQSSDTGVANFSSEDGMGEAEYEGGDEDEETIDHNLPHETADFDSDHPMSDVASDVTGNHNCTANTVNSDSERYYHNSLRGTYGSNMGRENSFTDLEVASGDISDPGVYRTKELESICSSPILLRHVEPEENDKANNRLPQQFHLVAASESESVRHPDSLSAVSGHRANSLSYQSSSAGCEGRELSSSVCLPTGGSLRSKGAIKRDTSPPMFEVGTSSQAMESQKRTPWWKVFLVSHRNFHVEYNGGVLSSLSEGNIESLIPLNGYISDMESKSGRLSRSTLLEVASDSEKKYINSRTFVETSQVSNCTSQLNLRTAELCTSEASEISAFPSYQSEFSSGELRTYNTAQRGDSCTGKTGLSRVEEWVSSVHNRAPFIDDVQKQTDLKDCPESPPAPAASFFGPGSCESDDRKQAAAASNRVDGMLDNDGEMTKMIALSVNPLSTVAHFSGVGLKLMPSLGTFGGLKILNLSANNFVRITPGCLPKSLHSLDISRNNIVVIEGLRELTRLRVLNLSFNRISRIGNGLSSCTSLKEAYLAGNKISEVEGLHRLSKLVVLDLSFNKLTTTKSMGQIAANYKSLQSFNLMGNAVHSNLGDDQMRRYVTGICPQLLYLNKQALKSVSNREALGKEPKGSGKNSSKPSKRGTSHQIVASHQRTYSVGVGGNLKNSGRKGGVQVALTSQGEGRSRKGYHPSKSTFSKDFWPKGFISLELTADTTYTSQKVRVSGRCETDGSPTAKSVGGLFCEDNHWSQTMIDRGSVETP